MGRMKKNVTAGAGRRLRPLVILGILVASFFGAQFAWAANSVVQTFYVPITEDQVRTWEYGINNAANDTNIYNVISITATMDGTIIYYDQWEDGYEPDIANPVQSTTRVWGDGDITNGAPPGCNNNSCDVVNAGTVISLQNSVPIVSTGTSYVRDPGNIYFDGRDKIAATGQLVITRVGWLASVGTVFAGAVEVIDTRKWGTSFVVPLGINSSTTVVGNMFSYSALSIMAKDKNTTVQVGATAYTLNEGQSVFVPNVNQGTTITASSPVHVDMMTGDVGTNYEGRWFALIPENQWSNSYYCPVSTVNTSDPPAVILYNPGTAAITVNVATTGGGSTTVTVPGSTGNPPSIARYNMPQNTGAHFYTTGTPAPSFFAIFTNDYDQQNYEWAAMMIPENSLTPSVVIGWAPGSDGNPTSQGNPPYQDDSPVWVTPIANTTIYVNYSGNPTVGPNTDPYGNKYDVFYTLNALQSQRIFHTATHNMTGARIYTVDGTRIAAFWGEDASSGVPGLPGLDLGTAVLPFPSLTAYKTATLIGDFNSNGGIDPDELLQYTIRIHNSGIISITNIVLQDTLPNDGATPTPNLLVTYVAGTTGYSITQSGPFTSIPDNMLPSNFPLLNGYTIVASPGQLDPGEDIYVRFQVTVNHSLPSGTSSLINTATVTSTSLQQLTVVSENFTNILNSSVQQGVLGVDKHSSAAGTKVKPGDTITYTVTVTNDSTTPQTGLQLNDPLPAGTSYVPNSTTATGPQEKYVKDMFNQLSYGNNDGPQSWKGNWTPAGDIQVINGTLRLNATNTANSSVARTVDLTTGSFTFSILRFDFRTSPTVIASDAVVVEMSNSASGTFTVLETFTGLAGLTSGSRIYEITPYISGDTTVRFRVTSGYSGVTDFFYADNIEIRAVGAFKDVLDQFSSVSYTNNNGPDQWKTSWTENDASGSSQNPAAGNVRVVTTNNPGGLRMQIYTSPTASSAYRTVDLSGGYVFGLLRFNFYTSSSVVATDAAVVEISSDGTNFTTLDTFTNITGATSRLRTYDISPYISANTSVRFRITSGYSGNNDYFYVDNVEIKGGKHSQPAVKKDNISGGAVPDLVSGAPPDLMLPADGFALAPGESLSVVYRVQVNNPANVTRVVNTATVTDYEKAPPASSTTIDPVSTGGTIGDLVWLDTIVNGTYDYGEPGLYNVRVWLDANNNGSFDSGERETRTGTDGKYVFEGLPPGTYRVFVDETTMPAGLAVTTGTTNPSSPVTITSEEIFLNVDFGYKNANSSVSTIGDYIWSDANYNGIQDPGEVGIGGVTVELRGGSTIPTATTNVFGMYLFTNVAPGTYTVVVTDTANKLAGYTPTTGLQSLGKGVNVPSDSLPVTGGNSYMMMDFGFYNFLLFSISNRLWFDLDNNGLLDTGEPGIKGVTIVLSDSSGNVKGSTLSDVNGNFSFTGVPNGTYTIRIEDATGKLIGFAGTTPDAQAGQRTVTVSNANVSGINFGYNAPGRIGDTIWRDDNGNGIQETGEPGIAGVAVKLYKDTNGNGLLDGGDALVVTKVTDADGQYLFQVSEAGRFFVSIDDGQSPLSGTVLTTIDDQPSAPGVQKTILFLSLNISNLTADFGYKAAWAGISGLVWNDVDRDTIRDLGETAISGVTVQLFRETSGTGFDPAVDQMVATTTTDSSGTYSFQVTQTGTYYVSIDVTQPVTASMTLTTTDDWPLVGGAQRTVSVPAYYTNYPNNNFGFAAPLSSDLGVTKTANPPGAVKPGDTITYTITITNNSATTTQTGITVNDPLPTYTTGGSGTVTGYAAVNSTFTADKDTYLNQAAAGNSYGATNPLIIQPPGGTAEKHILAHFNLSSIPLGSLVDATAANLPNMQFYVSTANAQVTGVDVYQLTKDWNEGSGNSQACGGVGNGATWTAPKCVAPNWTASGGDYSTNLGSFVLNSTGYKNVQTASLATLVQGWINSSATNYGVLLSATGTSGQAASIMSRTGTAGQLPRLTVNYYATQSKANGTPPNLVQAADGFVLPPLQSMTVTYQVTVSSSLPPGVTQIVNEATVSSNQTNPKKASVTNPVTYISDLKVEKTIKNIDSPCKTGSCNVTYTIKVTNVGSSAESGVVITDQLPADLTWISDSGGGTYIPSTGIWTVGNIGISGSASLDITAQVTGSSSSITNCASLTASTPADTNPSNDSSCASITPTHVTLSDFRVYGDNGRVVVEWATSSEIGTAGFYLFRKDNPMGDYQRINRRILPALLTSPRGGTYSLIDNGASPNKSYTYLLIEIEAKGGKNVYGPFTVRPGGDGAVENLGLSHTINPDLLLKPARELKSPSGGITQYVNKDGTIVFTNQNMSKQGDAAAGGDLFSSYTRKAKAPSDSRRASLKASSGSSRSPVDAGSTPLTGSLVKIPITKEGIYYLSASDISTAFSLTDKKTIGTLILQNQIALSSQGQGVAYTPDSYNSGILFYGHGLNNIYTDENVYWLSLNRGFQMEGGGSSRGPTPAGRSLTFTDTIHAEENKIVVPVLFTNPEADYWFWDIVVGGDPDYGTRTFTIPANDVATSSTVKANLTINLYGFTDTKHHAMVSLNGTDIGGEVWEGPDAHELVLDFDQGLLNNGANSVIVKGVLDNGVPYSLFYVDSFDLTYERLYRAVNNALICRGDGNPVVTITGFSGSNVLVFDITDSMRPKIVGSTTIAGGKGNYSVSFSPVSPEAAYLSVMRGSVASVTDVSASTPAGLMNPSNSADYLIITTPELESASQSLASYRQSKGLTPKIVFLEDIMNEFNYGVYDPKAIRAFLTYAYHNWIKPPKYVVLAGNGTYDYKDNEGYGDNLIPTLMANTPMGLYESDSLFAEFDGDHVPKIAIGRLPVLTAEELNNMIDKIKSYEGGTGKHVLWLADDPDDGGNFPIDSDDVAALLPPGYTSEKIYLVPEVVDQTRQTLLAGINGGAAYLNYIGHAGPDRLASEGLLTTGDVSSMNNAAGPHVMTAMTCLAGQFATPGYDSLSESLVLKKDGGSAAVWAPTGYSFNSLAKVLDEAFFKAAFGSPKTALGDAILKAFKEYSTTGGQPYMIDIYTLLGDPALQLR